MTPRVRAAAAAVLLPALCAAFGPSAAAQVAQEIVPRSLYSERLRQDGNQITFCLNPYGVLADFERALATAIGDVLLARVEFYEVPETAFRSQPFPLDYRLGLSDEQLFILLAQECDAFLGFLLSPVDPDWLTVSRAYLSAGTVLVTTDPAVASLDDLPEGARIGVRMMAEGDGELIRWLDAVGEAEGLRRTPYPDNGLLMRRLEDGTLGAAMIWEPGLWSATQGDPSAAGLTVLEETPFPVRPIRMGIATRVGDDYLQTLLSDAIAALVDDGTIARLLEERGLVATAGG